MAEIEPCPLCRGTDVRNHRLRMAQRGRALADRVFSSASAVQQVVAGLQGHRETSPGLMAPRITP